MKPKYVERANIPKEVIEKERIIVLEEAKQIISKKTTKLPEDKKESIINLIIGKKMDAFYKEICLMEQQFVIESDGDETVSQALNRMFKSEKMTGKYTVSEYILYPN